MNLLLRKRVGEGLGRNFLWTSLVKTLIGLTITTSFWSSTLYGQTPWSRSMLDGNPIAAFNKASYTEILDFDAENMQQVQNGSTSLKLSQPGYLFGKAYNSIDHAPIEQYHQSLSNETREQIKNNIDDSIGGQDNHEALIIFTGFLHGVDYYLANRLKIDKYKPIFLSPALSDESKTFSESARDFYQKYDATKTDLTHRLKTNTQFREMSFHAKQDFIYSKTSGLLPVLSVLALLTENPTFDFKTAKESVVRKYDCTSPFVILDNHVLDEVEHIVNGLPSTKEFKDNRIQKVVFAIEGLDVNKSYSISDLVKLRQFSTTNDRHSEEYIVLQPGFFTLITKIKEYQSSGIEIEIHGLNGKKIDNKKAAVDISNQHIQALLESKEYINLLMIVAPTIIDAKKYSILDRSTEFQDAKNECIKYIKKNRENRDYQKCRVDLYETMGWERNDAFEHYVWLDLDENCIKNYIEITYPGKAGQHGKRVRVFFNSCNGEAIVPTGAFGEKYAFVKKLQNKSFPLNPRDQHAFLYSRNTDEFQLTEITATKSGAYVTLDSTQAKNCSLYLSEVTKNENYMIPIYRIPCALWSAIKMN